MINQSLELIHVYFSLLKNQVNDLLFLVTILKDIPVQIAFLSFLNYTTCSIFVLLILQQQQKNE